VTLALPVIVLQNPVAFCHRARFECWSSYGVVR
jgi:hypothetical protein